MLFGHQNDDTTQPADNTPVMQGSGLNPLAVDPATGASLPVAPMEPVEQTESSPEASVLNQSPSSDSTATAPTVDVPTQPEVPTPDPISAEPQVATDSPTTSDIPSVSLPSVDDSSTPPTSSDDLLSLKQQALTQLSPLVSQLDQTPEEKFRTTMMMIQSTDNQALIKDAYDAAQQIPEEKTRAQALLDVVNEINYFTQQK